MPPKTRISEEMIVSAALEIIKEHGEENLNVRALASKLNCSTQPIMYHFDTIEQLKNQVYAQADSYHTQWLMRSLGQTDPLLQIGLNYIRFAIEEPRLFRFLFQSGYVREKNIMEMIDSPQLLPVLSAMQQGLQLDREKTKEVFVTVALFTHGYASIIANNDLEFDEEIIAGYLERVLEGALMAAGVEV